MDGRPRGIDRRLARLRRVEPFVGLIVAGGLALVAGLWLAELGRPAGPVRLAGLCPALVGGVSLAQGIRRQVDG